MQRCFQLAVHGLGGTYPNPLVGCVIVAHDAIIGEGFHQKAGGPHAEVEAIRSITNEALLEDATVYVNLEPCAHHGRTPPCADLLIVSKVKRVIIANTDPFPEVSGRGIERLRAAGVEVITGILSDEGEYLNRRFFTYWKKRRPYIILKWAQSADGFMDKLRGPHDRGSHPISSAPASRLVHLWRAQEQAILVGTRTAMTDNPYLTVRHVQGPNPVRLAIDPEGVLPGNLRLFRDDTPSFVLRSDDAGGWAEEMYGHGIQSVLVEGGAKTLRSFIEAGLWDEARVIQSPALLHGGLPAPLLPGSPYFQESCGPDQIDYFYPPA